MPPLQTHPRPSPSTLCGRRSFPLLSLAHTNSSAFHFFHWQQLLLHTPSETAKALLERGWDWDSCCRKQGAAAAAASFPQAGAASLDLWEARVGKDFRALTALAAQTVLHLLQDRADSKDGSSGPSSTSDLPVGINCYVKLKMLEEKRNCISFQINGISRRLVPKVIMVKND